jgi:tetratricopeptide (TPR) repeat protein
VFVNRAAEQSTLDRAWEERQGPLWVGVEGPPGVGKTALSVTWGHSRVDRWPDGALYADHAHGDVETVLAGWLRALGLPTLPRHPDHLHALWRTVTTHRRVLVVADNTTPDAARCLLPAGADSAGIAIGHTGMADLVAVGTHYLSLRPLVEKDTRDLIVRLVRRRLDDDVLTAAVGTASGNPLAATLTVSYLVLHPSATPDQLATRQEHTIVDRVTGILQKLPDDLALAARLLAAHPGPYLTPDLAGAVLDTAPERARTALHDLVKVGLITDLGQDRYAHHQLVHGALDRHLEPDSRNQVLDTVASFYRLRLAAAGEVINPWRWKVDEEGVELARRSQEDGPWFTDRAAAFAWIDGELDNIRAVTRMCRNSNRPDPVWQIGDHIGTYVTHRVPWSLVRELYPAGLEAAEAAGNVAATALMHQRLGGRVGADERTAHDHATEALRLYQQAGHRPGVASAHESLAGVDLKNGNLDEAAQKFALSERLHLEIGRQRGAALQARKGAQVLTELGRPAEALAKLRRARETLLGLEQPDRYQATRCLQGIVDAHLAMGDLDQAEQAAHTALEEAHATGAVYQQATLRVALADVERARGDKVQERVQLTRAVELLEPTGHPDTDKVRERLTNG